MTGPTLVEFLRARLAERVETVARWDSDGRAQVAVMWTGPEPGYTTVAMAHPDTPWIADGREVADARHVKVLYDPADVLADVEIKRRIIALHAHDAPNPHECPTWKWRDPDHPDDPAETDTGWAADCATLRLLAQPYAEHPDYRPEWRP